MYMYLLSFIVVSLVVAYILQISFKKMEVRWGFWNRLLGAAIGAIAGDLALGDWGFMFGGYNVIAGIIGAAIIGWLYIYIMSRTSFGGHRPVKSS